LNPRNPSPAYSLLEKKALYTQPGGISNSGSNQPGGNSKNNTDKS